MTLPLQRISSSEPCIMERCHFGRPLVSPRQMEAEVNQWVDEVVAAFRAVLQLGSTTPEVPTHCIPTNMGVCASVNLCVCLV